MGFLSSIISNALSKGIEKGLGKAVSSAVESIVKPSVDKLAQSQAKRIDEATKNLEKLQADAESEVRWATARQTAATAKLDLDNLSPSDAEVLKRMQTVMPMFPVWCVGGSDFQFEDHCDAENKFSYSLSLTGDQEMLDAYKMVLLANGFRFCRNDYSSDVIYKVIDDDCYCFIFTDAITDDNVYVGFMIANEYKPQ